MTERQIIKSLTEARETMQYLISIQSPLCERQERLINRLKAQLMKAGARYAH